MVLYLVMQIPLRRALYNLATDKYKGIIIAPLKAILFFCALIYGFFIRILALLRSLRPVRLNCKVISIGNITVGGTGKTVLVEYVAKYLQAKAHRIAILSRGYKRRPETIGDEPSMLRQKLKDVQVIVDTNRMRAAKLAVDDFGCDTVILDDGFQQWGIKKDLEIVTIDSTSPFGNEHMIPRGILREPLSSLRRCDIFVLTKTDLSRQTAKLKAILSGWNPEAVIFDSVHKPLALYDIANPAQSLLLGVLKGKTVGIFSGIGDPGSFESLVIGLGAKIGLDLRFDDHHDYKREDFVKIIQSAQERNIDTVITTEKDASRINNLPTESSLGRQFTTGGLKLLVLRIELEIKNEQEFYNRLHKLYAV